MLVIAISSFALTLLPSFTDILFNVVFICQKQWTVNLHVMERYMYNQLCFPVSYRWTLV